jgi:membrane associated rhomboid family serine protease
MREAAVGFQCPDCVREGSRGQRTARTSFGGRPAGTPTVTFTLIAVNLAVFVATIATGASFAFGDTISSLHERFAMLPTTTLHIESDGVPKVLEGIAQGEWWRLVTSNFLHYGVVHIVFNMLALLALGPQLEAVLGRVRFLALYLVAGLSGSVLSYVAGPEHALSAGASGAIFGMFGAYVVVAKRLNQDASQILGLIAVNLVISFALPFIDWRGHIGGLVGGSLVALAMAYAPRGSYRVLVQTSGTLLVVAVAVALTAARTAQLN